MAAVAGTDDEASQGGETGLLPGGPRGDTAVDDAVQDLGEVLEVAELRDGAGVEGERRGVAAVHPERGGVEPLAVRLAGAAHAAEVAREAERGAGLGRPRVGEEGGDGRGRGARDDVEEEVEAGVPRGDERRRRVLRARLLRRGRRLRSRLVELGVHQVQERVAGGGHGRGRLLGRRRRARGRRAEALCWWAEEGVGHGVPARRSRHWLVATV